MILNFKDLTRAATCLFNTDTLSWPQRASLFRTILFARPEAAPQPVHLPLRNGVLAFHAGEGADWRVYKGIFVDGVYATDYRKAVVIDIGAHRGMYASYALQEGCSHVLAYEPEPGNFSFLQKNTARFSRPGQRVDVFQQAVGSESKTVTFFTYDQSWSHSVVDRADKKPLTELEVQQAGFAGVLSQATSLAKGGKKVIVKIDAEGAEYDILQQTPAELLKVIDELFVEVHDYASGNPGELLQHLYASGLSNPEQREHSPGKHQLLYFARHKAGSQEVHNNS